MSVQRAILRTAGRLTPSTRWYRLRRRLLQAQGFEVARDARITSSATFLVGRLSIGAETFVGHRVRVYGGPQSLVRIGARCDIGPEVCVLAGTHRMADGTRRAGLGKATTVTVEDGCWIGGRAVLIGPCRVGAGSVVAAGSTVRADVPANSLYFGPGPTDLRPLTP